MEPRTVTAKSWLTVIHKLSAANIPVRLMMAPIVPGLNSDEIPALIKAAADEGVLAAIFTVIRLNGSIAEIFTDWIHKAYPDRADKVLHAIAECHGGKLNDSDWGRRMRGEGNVAESIHQLFRISVNRFLSGRSMPPQDLSHFTPAGGKQMDLF
jgi:DNA repair photolyase